MRRRYAHDTAVPVEKSRAEIERLVTREGAGQFMSAYDNEQGKAVIGWTMRGRMVRLSVPLPKRDEKRFRHPRSSSGNGSLDIYREYTAERRQELWEQACRSRWRAVGLIIKAKFEAIAAGISTFEHEFLADTVMANGATLGEWVAPQLQTMYESGSMPKLLPGMGETSR